MDDGANLECLPRLADEIAAAASPSAAILQSILAVLRGSDATLEGHSYHSTTGNTLPPDYLIQNKPNQSQSEFWNAFSGILTQFAASAPAAPHFIDIAHLGLDAGRANDQFEQDIADALVALAKASSAPITVRFLEGLPNDGSPLPFDFANILLGKTSGQSGLGNLTCWIGNLNVPWADGIKKLPGSWNHSKILAVDGACGMVGGMNYWNDYLSTGSNANLYDAAIKVVGEAAASSQAWADYLWKQVDVGGTSEFRSLKLGDSAFGSAAIPYFSGSGITPPPATGSLPVLAVGNLGLWTLADQSALALEYGYARLYEQVKVNGRYASTPNIPLWFPFSHFDPGVAKAQQASSTARHVALSQVKPGGNLRISQQKIADTDTVSRAGFVIWPGNFLDDVANALKNGVTVDIILSSFETGASGYQDDMGGNNLRKVIAERLGSDSKLLTVRQVPSYEYNHAKIWIVDDSAFFVGSDNIYPGFLQEHGYVIADRAATQQFITDYWNPLWAAGVAPTDPKT
ncbi:phospholipase D-like domain-containing protein [Erythrobacter sp. JK5]|uniref:phospholipase D-like domain-containing protein n=1 Tax=Erythrobacter sp. JK5 TaxID=2829500 RepID=UPI001BAAA03B|nr:phospholipase D-like domain-containing protein [Erythrobacter sp. JK5]QUL39256.1 hypothetical protein KDC96_08100 [Erythrobacter sp. JK5]